MHPTTQLGSWFIIYRAKLIWKLLSLEKVELLIGAGDFLFFFFFFDNYFCQLSFIYLFFSAIKKWHTSLILQCLILPRNKKKWFKEFLKRQLEKSYLLIMAESSNQYLRMNFLLVCAMYNSDFDEVLAERLREIFFLIKCIVIKGGLLISLGN